LATGILKAMHAGILKAAKVRAVKLFLSLVVFPPCATYNHAETEV